jgi:Flp pilus assembly secretin CpaC
MSLITLDFTLEKETKNSVRYKEVPALGQAPILGTLYIQKWYAGSTKNISVTIEKKD